MGLDEQTFGSKPHQRVEIIIRYSRMFNIGIGCLTRSQRFPCFAKPLFGFQLPVPGTILHQTYRCKNYPQLCASELAQLSWVVAGPPRTMPLPPGLVDAWD